jgi:hypothetical protein
MEDIQLPRHVIDRLENRWASRLQQDAKARRAKGAVRSGYDMCSLGSRDIPVLFRRARRAADALRPE